LSDGSRVFAIEIEHGREGRKQLTLAQVHVAINLEITIRTRVGRVLGDDETVRRGGGAGLAEKGVCFDEHLVVAAGLDGLVAVVLVDVVVDVLEQRQSSVPKSR
jgi:hypothetical protein